ncbi:MAG: type II toxin-antitoxin system PemK/MazF family toxin [Chitinophagaceae bacterium]|nr:type II toxin-antitoxin system PemK/MazF family toxin [Chitinophagaceae bacterium]
MKRGSIILIPFYFTDFKGYKRRPAVIGSLNQSQTGDFIVAFISTIIPTNNIVHKTHFIVKNDAPYFTNTGLFTTSIIKCDKLMTIHKSIIEGILGEIPQEILSVLDDKLRTALSLQ